jgi:hypothetical protein
MKIAFLVLNLIFYFHISFWLLYIYVLTIYDLILTLP